MREGRALLRSLYAQLQCPWISPQAAISSAEAKPHQISVASQIGFNVPDTLVTNDPLNARRFVLENGPVVLKAASYGDLGRGRVLHTTLLPEWLDDYNEEIRTAPHLLQRFVDKVYDYRVTVVDRHVFACRIHSQSFLDYSVDMRRGLSDMRMQHDKVDLPTELAGLCADIVAKLGLRFGAIDIVEDKTGKYWFLEINPNGQWAWIQDRTGTPIATTIAEALCYAG